MGSVVRIAVMGSKDFDDYETVRNVLEKVVLGVHDPRYSSDYTDAIFVFGGSAGVEAQARAFAEQANYSYVLYKPPFMVAGTDHTPSDFGLRRTQMVDNCDFLIVIKKPEDGSLGRVIARARRLRKAVHIEEIQDV